MVPQICWNVLCAPVDVFKIRPGPQVALTVMLVKPKVTLARRHVTCVLQERSQRTQANPFVQTAVRVAIKVETTLLSVCFVSLVDHKALQAKANVTFVS